MECPNIDRTIKHDQMFLNYNKPINYKDMGGNVDYIFYDHNNGYDFLTRVQFCKLIGRKGDVFQCLNENEWKVCPYYLSNKNHEKCGMPNEI